ncbi:MAG TPA: ABC transporter permease subunit [Candidatus Ornithocaccomicrobium faecavium]|uniref:ABC transporter permease subunit n=1 Tax=Candidatus Ornithocaccomicrobium faecavium TaxID=2840890 RepID=A0A9D1TCY3_9FIRM|nr:ABC transporter permease subunit [Candidatus Ornithocaccomicrobium faecavium]
MAENARKPRKNINVPCLVLAIVFCLALIASICTYFYAASGTEIFTKVGFGATLQNSRIMADDENDMTFLGTYANTIIGVDAEGNHVWTQPISGAVGAMEYDTDNDWLVVGSQDRNVYVFNSLTGELLMQYPVNGKVDDLDYDQASKQILVSSGVSATKHTLAVLNLETGEELFSLSLRNTASAAQFSPDLQYIYYGDSRGRITKIDWAGETIAQERADGEVRDLSVDPVTGDVLTLDEYGLLQKYDPDLNLIFEVEVEGEGRCLGVSADGKWIGVGTREGDAHLLNSAGEILYSLKQQYDTSQIYFGAERSYIVTLSADLYEFSTDRLNNISQMDTLQTIALIGIIVFAVLTLEFGVLTFARGRALEAAFFRAIYRHKAAYLMLLPSIVLILIFNYYNVFQAFYYAFTDWSQATRTMREVQFVGFDNFRRIFTEGYFLLGVKNLLIMMAASFIKLLTVPLLLAELVFAMRTRTGESSRRRYWFRLLLVLPMVVPGVVSTLMWKNIYDPNIGALNALLKTVGLESWQRVWLGDEATALWAIIFMGFPWVNSFAFLVFYGGLINIPEDLFEAAKVDGSNPAWNFFHIHLPLISPQLKMLIITTFISSVQDYGGVMLLTAGGPGTATYVPGLELYYAATRFGQYGYACAMGVLMFIVILAGSLLNLKIRTEEALG